MQDRGAGGGDVGAVLREWRNGLVNLTGTNRLINFKRSKTGTLEVKTPAGQDVLDGLRANQVWSFQGSDSSQKTDGLHVDKPEKELGPALRDLLRKAKEEFLDRGLSVLYLAFGLLEWQEDDGTAFVSPLLIVPVEPVPVGPRDMPQLRMGDDDPVLNPALALRMREFGIALPVIADLDDLDLDWLFKRVRQAVSKRAGWTVTDGTILSTFSFHKEAMYRDLLENESAVLEHPAVQALVSQSSEFLFEEIRPEDVERLAPPEDTPLVLDADSSQRACVAAAVAGHSFVMDGPPGTGKSQTIANMIGALLHAGKTVLFVSEKVAALEVVRNRLDDAGLAGYLLELHSHKASRKEVADSLVRALDRTPVPPPGLDAAARSLLAGRRWQLNLYARAMNEVREPLGLTLHDVLGRIAQLEGGPAAPVLEHATAGLTQESLQQIHNAAERLSRAWRPVAHGSSFLWRDVLNARPLGSTLDQAQAALEELTGLVGRNRSLADAFAVERPSDTPAMAALLQLAANRPAEARDEWLTRPDAGELDRMAELLARDLAAVRDAAQTVLTHTGVAWRALPDPPVLPAESDLAALIPMPLPRADLTAATARSLADRFTADAELLGDRLQALEGFTNLLTLPAVRTIRDAETVLNIIDMAYIGNRPERAWLTPAGLAAARTAMSALRRCIDELETAEKAARAYFTDAALDAPLAELHDRFENVHTGLRKSLGGYRRDKQALTAFTIADVAPAAAIEHLELALNWQQAQARFDATVATSAAVLGAYWRGLGTKFPPIEEALAKAAEIAGLVPAAALRAVADHVCAPTPPPQLRALAISVRSDLNRRRSMLAPASASAARPEVLFEPLTTIVAGLGERVRQLHDQADRADAFSAAVRRELTFAETEAVLRHRQAVVDAEAVLDSRADTYRAAFGEVAFQGPDTDEQALTRAIGWARDTRRARWGDERRFTDGQLQAFGRAVPSGDLAGAYARWAAARDAVTAAFHPSRHADLEPELAGFASAAELLGGLRADDGGQREWFEHLRAREELTALHLGAIVGFCVKQAVPGPQVTGVVEGAVLRAWADHVIAEDGALRPLPAEDRDALVAEYRRLDKALISAASGEIINAANTRRPTRTDIGEPAIIRREGLKKTRHMAVRDLIRGTRTTTLAVKPCFMMSPLAVSQYLPADMTFDVVIFDEASQVTPGDAINCVYRGRALITAGDDRQLPPTSFFDRMADDGGVDAAADVRDFQSILELAKGSGSFQNLGLRWHYRSRHEALIAFSNHSFYDGRLVTYPSPQSAGPDVGVEMFHVDGVYRRGTSRDNPIEVEKVVERVLHHYATRPGATLGVVTFSVAQSEAIQTALDKALLDQSFEDDRLNGFFVKSLESVQGDERDVIIFSIGYGPDEDGRTTAQFGALNRPKGWCRLNVAITRARQRVEIVTSIRAGDVPETTNDSVRFLVQYLDFAERGLTAHAPELEPSGPGPFEASVIGVIRSWGYVVEPQIGASGYRIDIGVRHPGHPGVFALGVECDGAMYHSAAAARDRDRLREEVLRGLGWNLHRIWGTAWHGNRQHEESRLRAAIEAAINAPVTRTGGLEFA